ncbi:hypothetical protein KCU64_g1942, partial [Aureobasidium melanogenum]
MMRLTVTPRLFIVVALTILILYAFSTTTYVRFEHGSAAALPQAHPSLNSESSEPADQKSAEEAPVVEAPPVEATAVYNFNEKNDLIIKSRSNPSGDANRIDSMGLSERLFNPAILELPTGSKHNFLIIARMAHIPDTINGKQYSRGRELAFFANLEHDDKGAPIIRRSGEWNRTILEGEGYPGPEHHCESEDAMDKYIGPEDAKLYWMHSGAPILVFTHQVPYEGECQGMFMIDARAAVPELITAFDSHASSLPDIEFTKPRQVRRPRQEVKETSWSYRFEREKNWVPFQHTPLADDSDTTNPNDFFFHVQAESTRIYRFVPDQKYVAGVTEPPAPQTCLKDNVAEGLHQGTPLLSLTLCKRGECAPDKHNTILLGLVQRRQVSPYTWYDSRIVTWNATEPFAFRSVSKRVIYQGTQEHQYNWNCGLIYHWNSTAVPQNRSHGYLDDEMWVTYGVTDREAGWVDVMPEDLLKDHTMCH